MKKIKLSALKNMNNFQQWLLVSPGIILFLFIIIIPTFVTFYFSFFRWDGVGSLKFIGLLNYKNLFVGKIFWTSFRNNFLILFVYCSFPVFFALLLAIFLVNTVTKMLGTHFSNLFRICYYLPQVIPGTAFLLAWRWILGPNGAVNAILIKFGLNNLTMPWLGNSVSAMIWISIILTWVHCGLCMIIFIAGLSRIDTDLYDALKLDGANKIHEFKNVILPEISYEVKVLVIFGILEAFKLFDFAYILTKGGPGFSTYFAAYYLYQAYFYSADIGQGATITCILTICVFIISIISVRVKVGYDR
jgi:raffinose/stachyose/melibiose transport system permease protein